MKAKSDGSQVLDDTHEINILRARVKELEAKLSSETACAKAARDNADYFRQFVYSANGQQRSL
jgi:hypothetical protein